MGIGRRAGGVAVMALLALGGVALLVRGDGAAPEGAGVVTVRRPAAAAPAAPPPPVRHEPLLAPPVAPVLPDTVAAPGDAFVGDWRADDGQRLSIVAQPGGYGVTLGDERYDAVVRDGRLHFPRGIDGDWLQAAASARCVVLGSGTRFCAEG